ncbi:MAG: aquaporin [Rhodoplanes sp.]
MAAMGKRLSVAQALRAHWPEYLMEAWGLGTFMVSAGVFAALLEYPGSPVHQAIPNGDLRLVLMGLAMGLTAIAIIYSPWGKQSGAHINPAVTLTFLRLGKINPIDAGFYILAQFIGGTAGIILVWAVLGSAFSEPPVVFINTKPGDAGVAVAYFTEAAMAGGLMLVVLTALSWEKLTPHVGYFAGIMVAGYIAFFAPLSGMSINPARTFASAAPSGELSYLWLYFTAPVFGMLAAAELFRVAKLGRNWFCAKLIHDSRYRCIHCGYEPGKAARGQHEINR